jgi:toxin ParE1/3/4
MDRNVVWTEPAARDLEAIVQNIARDSEAYATSFAREIREAARSLSVFAERGQRVPEFDLPEIREFLVRPYRIVYRVEPERVVILTVIHGARRARRV